MMGRTIFCLIFILTFSCISAQYVKRNDTACGIPSYQKENEVCNWHYLAYFPRIFRTGVKENVMLSTHGFPKIVNVKISLLNTGNKNKEFSSVEYTVKPETLSTLPVFVDHNAPSHVKVQITGTGEVVNKKKWVFKNTSRVIYVQRLGYSIFIQTDRPLYKPGQKIRGRVIVIDTKLKPYEGKIDKIIIENPSGSRMRQWSNVELEEGFASFELQTSEKPVVGKWKVKVELKTYKKSLDITVKKYVLPKFQVVITPPAFISKSMKTINADICAKYSYGKSVFGKLNAKICMKRKYYDYARRHEENECCCVKITRKILGCTSITVDVSELTRYEGDSRYNTRYVSITGSVKETATELVMNATRVQKNVVSKEVVLSFQAKDVFKPGFPLSVKLFAKYPDETPIKKIVVNVTVGTSGYNSKDLLDMQIKIINGVSDLKLPPVPFNAEHIRLRAVYRREELEPNEPNWRRESYRSYTIKPWYSPSHSYLSIEKLNGPVKNGSNANIKVYYTSVNGEEKERTIFYSLMCSGNVASSGSFKRTFIAATPENPTTVPTTTTTTTTTTVISEITNDTGKISTVPRPTPLIYKYWWNRERATRPPLPYQFERSSFEFSFLVTPPMIPSCRMVVYYMRGEEVVADNMEIDVLDEFENKVSIQFDQKEVKPGETAKLSVTGYPKSRIAIAAVDKSIHFLAQGNDLKPDQLSKVRKYLDISPGWTNEYSRCHRSWGRKKRSISPGYSTNDYVDSEIAFVNVGTQFLTSLNVDVRPCGYGGIIRFKTVMESTDSIDGTGPATPNGGNQVKKKTKKKSTRPRTEFPETWLWTEERLSENGSHVFDVKVPDTITSWYASGFGISKVAGLGVANPTQIRVFQAFFISLNLPYSVIRGEDVTIPAAVFSYLDKSCATVRISLAFSSEYRIIAGPRAKSCICGGRTTTVLFRIKPKVIGKIKIKVSAETLQENSCAVNRPYDSTVQMSDILIKKLIVEPEGVKKDYTISNFFCPKEASSGVYKTSIKLKLPENVVAGSIYSKVNAIGDIMGASLANIDKLLAMPYGCGEQNMLKFAPNIFIMNYLKNTNQVTEAIKSKALNYMRTGYQRELTYRHKDGSYSAFGERDSEGSTWLTAFVLKSYAQARPWIDVDDEEVNLPTKWLLKHQQLDGCFPTIGDLHHKAMKGGVKTPITLTAYVLITLLEAGVLPTDAKAVKASDCVSNSIDNVNDTYSLAIISYMFAKMGDLAKYDEVMGRLQSMAVKEDGMTHWEEPQKEDDISRHWYYQARSSDIEQTAYVLLAILQFNHKHNVSNTVQQSIPIVRWLSKQRNGLGGWSSTQDTVLAMQALSEFAEITYGTALDLTVDVQSGDLFQHKFKINKKNNLVLQRVEELPVPGTLDISATGSGCALLQTIVQYNIKKVETKPSFYIHQLSKRQGKPSKRKSCASQQIQVCTRWLRDGFSNMAIVEVQMISGFEPVQSSLDKALERTLGLKDIELKGKKVHFYFNRIGAVTRCFNFLVEQTTVVRRTKPAAITVYDYYDTEKSATIIYGFNREQCTGKVR